MALIKTINTGLYRIPLTVTLSDSTHGKITAFELITCHVSDADGAEGVGYTYTVGRNGGAIADALRREAPGRLTLGVERAAFEERHDEEGRAVFVDVVVEDADDAGVLHAVGDVALAHEAMPNVLVR